MQEKRGFTLVELMVVVAIIAILAAVALPMYSRFRERSNISTVLKSASGSMSSLQGWYLKNGSFTSPSVSANGGSILIGGKNVGSGLPQINNLQWALASPSSSVIQVSWHFTERCPPEYCDGYWQLFCSEAQEKCTVTIKLDDLNTLGLNKL